MTRTRGPTVIDLFCGGAGGWSLGLHRAGYRTVAACEADPWRRAMFAANFPGVRMYDDVRELTAGRIISDLGYRPDLLVGSPPCQDASAANTRGQGVDGERTGLFFPTIRLVGDLRPRWVALENVPRLRTRGADRVLGALEEIGYSAWPFVVGAHHVRANHKRERVWIIAFDPAQIGHGGGGAWRYWPHGNGAAHAAPGDAADADEVGRRSRAAGSDRAEAENLSRHAGEAGFPLGEGVGTNDAWQCAAAERASGQRRDDAHPDEDGQSHSAVDVEMGGREGAGEDAGEPWSHWNGGLAHHLRLDHGLSTELAAASGDRASPLHGLAGRIVAAYGDAVVPQIPEAIGRAIRRVEAAVAAARSPIEEPP
ncbi:DNA cytosine methyltransferase [Methylosinus trichosporium OB3b]|uniref:DNA (cytosine-5-)-methyltransferase n=1 Tax=Methylosinus trichosporium (strain ATCC 35070 / NCIMB 11131 / UNIQEM 75 / OB3b) TaxID=595536 RepID=A0A2D2CYN2_METT3|nr:DNA cytosine methyltransferase [Methylosinus trichosporium OB3b]